VSGDQRVHVEPPMAPADDGRSEAGMGEACDDGCAKPKAIEHSRQGQRLDTLAPADLVMRLSIGIERMRPERARPVRHTGHEELGILEGVAHPITGEGIGAQRGIADQGDPMAADPPWLLPEMGDRRDRIKKRRSPQAMGQGRSRGDACSQEVCGSHATELSRSAWREQEIDVRLVGAATISGSDIVPRWRWGKRT
jgi:hypothetical protein